MVRTLIKEMLQDMGTPGHMKVVTFGASNCARLEPKN
jgi:hypothetical protein